MTNHIDAGEAMYDTKQIIAQIDARIAFCRDNLAAAEDMARRIDETRAEIERLEAAKKSLTAPQTPAGRKRIGEGQRRRKKAEPAASAVAPVADGIPVKSSEPAAPATAQCSQCHKWDAPGILRGCGEDGCEAVLHPACEPAHANRWHLGTA